MHLLLRGFAIAFNNGGVVEVVFDNGRVVSESVFAVVVVVVDGSSDFAVDASVSV